MLRLNTLNNAVDYYTKSLSYGDYYGESKEIVGLWNGKGRELLGLENSVNKENFSQLCKNINPTNGTQLSAKNIENRRQGYDFTFSVPKSLSIQYAITKDNRIIDSFESSVCETMDIIEQTVQTRVRKNHKNENRITGNILYANFLHKSARPIDGYSDPHLHIHCVVLNQTFDYIENKWKAIELRDKFENREYYEKIFNSILVNKLQSIGYCVVKTINSWELAHYDRKTIEKFSRRTAQIENKAEELGLTTDKQKDKIGSLTRMRKNDNISPNELDIKYRSLLGPEIVAQILSTTHNLTPQVYTDNTEYWLNYNINHAFERQSVISLQPLMAKVLKDGITEVSYSELLSQVENAFIGKNLVQISSSELLAATTNLSPGVTTNTIIQQEQKIVEYVNSQKNTFSPLIRNSAIHDDTLSDAQNRVVNSVVSSSDGIQLLIGKAGTGKSTVLYCLEKELIKKKETVLAVGPTTRSVEVLSTGKTALTHCRTLQNYIHDTELQKQFSNCIIFVDETSLVSTTQMLELLKITDTHNNRLLLIGDPQQQKSILRGNVLKTLIVHSQVSQISLNQIFRQKKEEYKRSVEQLSTGNTRAGLEHLQQLGAITQISDNETRIVHAANQYVNQYLRGEKVLVMTATHTEGREITSQIRTQLKGVGKLDDIEYQYKVLQNLSWTNAQKSEISNYSPGLIIQFNNRSKNTETNDSWIVITTARGLQIQNQINGIRTSIPTNNSKAFIVNRQSTVELGKQDLIQITRNTKIIHSKNTHKLPNGAVYRIKEIHSDGNITLDNGWTLPKEFKNFKYGYYSTIFQSQGVTAESSILYTSDQSCKLLNQDTAYVACSRFTRDCTIYTSNIEEFIQYCETPSRSTDALSAITPIRTKTQQLNHALKEGKVLTNNPELLQHHHRLKI
jgi:conjugative relaxase-like TrwC/TraI family protein